MDRVSDIVAQHVHTGNGVNGGGQRGRSRHAQPCRRLGIVRRAGGVLIAGLVGAAYPVLAEDCGRAQTLFEQSRWSISKEGLLSEAIRLCPRHAAALNNLGLVREKQGRLDEAEALYRRALAEDPEQPAPHAGLGDVRFALQDYDGAADHYEAFLGHLQSAKRLGDSDNLVQHEDSYREKLRLARRLAGHPEPVVAATEIARSLTTVVSSTSRSIGVHYKDNAYIDIAINFDFNSARVSGRSRAQLEQIALALRSPALKHARVRIEGHTDSIGSVAYNQDLSERRARSVRQALVGNHGISGERLETAGYGESLPVRSNGTDAGRAANRRVTFVNLGAM